MPAGHYFKAHKAVLAACRKFFYKFFQEFTQEPLVEIEGVSKMAFRHLIEFTYTAKLMIQGEEEANDVWKAAEFLQMLEAIKALEVSSMSSCPSSTVSGHAEIYRRRKVSKEYTVKKRRSQVITCTAKAFHNTAATVTPPLTSDPSKLTGLPKKA